MRGKARRLKAERGLDLLIVDYLQLMQGRSDSESRQQEISDISRSLKALAKELNVPVVALSNLLLVLIVELQGIEPWSREDERVPSTCLVAFDCRKYQARQQPQTLLSYCFLNSLAQQRSGPVQAVDTASPHPQNRGMGDDGLPLLKRDKLI